MSKIVKFGTSFAIDEKEIEDRYPGDRDKVIEYRKNWQLHDLVEKLVEVKGDELWEQDNPIPGIDNTTTFTSRLIIFTEAELKEHNEELLKEHGLL